MNFILDICLFTQYLLTMYCVRRNESEKKHAMFSSCSVLIQCIYVQQYLDITSSLFQGETTYFLNKNSKICNSCFINLVKQDKLITRGQFKYLIISYDVT